MDLRARMPMTARLPFGLTAKRLINQLWGWFICLGKTDYERSWRDGVDLIAEKNTGVY